jgi:hypothetical protein
MLKDQLSLLRAAVAAATRSPFASGVGSSLLTGCEFGPSVQSGRRPHLGRCCLLPVRNAHTIDGSIENNAMRPTTLTWSSTVELSSVFSSMIELVRQTHRHDGTAAAIAVVNRPLSVEIDVMGTNKGCPTTSSAGADGRMRSATAPPCCLHGHVTVQVGRHHCFTKDGDLYSLALCPKADSTSVRPVARGCFPKIRFRPHCF